MSVLQQMRLLFFLTEPRALARAVFRKLKKSTKASTWNTPSRDTPICFLHSFIETGDPHNSSQAIRPRRLKPAAQSIQKKMVLVFSALFVIGLASNPLALANDAAGQAGPFFSDVTTAANIDFTAVSGPTFSVITDSIEIMMQRNLGQGAAVGDYDRDGDLDLYLLGSLGQPNALYQNQLDLGTKTFDDVTLAAGVGDVGLSRVAHFVDVDNDGWLDLVLINDNDDTGVYLPSTIYRNDRDGTFSNMNLVSNIDANAYVRCGAAMADYDGDGLLDLYVTRWGLYGAFGPARFPGSNRLYHNLGGFAFEDVTDSTNLGTLDRDSFTAIFTDFNDDNRPDLFVAIDHSSDEFYWNLPTGFVNATTAVGATHRGNDMGLACADFDDDGDLDVYATNVISPASSFFNAFNINLYDSTGTTFFEDRAVAHGVEDSDWGWGVDFIDVENDGDLDIAAVNGFDEFVGSKFGVLSRWYQTPSILFVNDGTGLYTRTTPPGFENPDDSRALIVFDYDRDGDQDVLITNVGQPARLLENTTNPSGNWLDVSLLQQAGLNRNGIGATIFATIGSITKRRDILVGESYLAGTPAEVHFGLGAATQVDELTIEWTDGTTSQYNNVPVNQFITLSQTRGDCSSDMAISAADFNIMQTCLAGPSLSGSSYRCPCADMDGDGDIDLNDFSQFSNEMTSPQQSP